MIKTHRKIYHFIYLPFVVILITSILMGQKTWASLSMPLNSFQENSHYDQYINQLTVREVVTDLMTLQYHEKRQIEDYKILGNLLQGQVNFDYQEKILSPIPARTVQVTDQQELSKEESLANITKIEWVTRPNLATNQQIVANRPQINASPPINQASMATSLTAVMIVASVTLSMFLIIGKHLPQKIKAFTSLSHFRLPESIHENQMSILTFIFIFSMILKLLLK